MKFTIEIDIPEIDQLINVQDELAALDTELAELMNAVQVGQDTPAGDYHSVTLANIVKRAAAAVQNNPAVDDTQRSIETYSKHVIVDATRQAIAPHQKALGKKVRRLLDKNAKAAPVASVNLLTFRNILYEAIGQNATENIQYQITEQVHKRISELFEETEAAVSEA